MDLEPPSAATTREAGAIGCDLMSWKPSISSPCRRENHGPGNSAGALFGDGEFT